jgi:hypothetical protein
MTRPTFRLVCTYPIYHWNTDAYMGTRSNVLRYFETEALARKIASRLNADEDETLGGEQYFEVQRTDGKALSLPAFAQPAYDDEIPF